MKMKIIGTLRQGCGGEKTGNTIIEKRKQEKEETKKLKKTREAHLARVRVEWIGTTEGESDQF